ncbi:MAG TPA: acyl-CoA dehydrogenase family protein [Pseudonocardia sp.]|nr:acyl-CoA dehydrogenase family protein [Pseudonocardia sp.]
MQFRFGDEHEELRRGLRRLLDGAGGPASDPDEPLDDGLIKRLVDELGVYALAVPEEFGGAGFGFVELGVVFHEAGRSLLRAPLLSTTLATVLLSGGDDRELVSSIAAGTRSAAAAIHDPSAVTAVAASDGTDGWELTGTADWVLDGAAAQVLVVAADSPAGPALFTVDASLATVEPITTTDPSRRVARVHLERCPGRPVEQDAAATLERARSIALALLAAEQTGIAEVCLEVAADWARQREQFGRPIGSFQAIKHKLADVRLELEAAVSASMYALWAADSSPTELPVAARIAAVTCGEAAVLSAQENIQVHGGIGATWEHHAHLYLRRALLDRLLFGDTQAHLAELADEVDRIAEGV